VGEDCGVDGGVVGAAEGGVEFAGGGGVGAESRFFGVVAGGGLGHCWLERDEC
jgi:hypothetical protein